MHSLGSESSGSAASYFAEQLSLHVSGSGIRAMTSPTTKKIIRNTIAPPWPGGWGVALGWPLPHSAPGHRSPRREACAWAAERPGSLLSSPAFLSLGSALVAVGSVEDEEDAPALNRDAEMLPLRPSSRPEDKQVVHGQHPLLSIALGMICPSQAATLI